MQRERRREVKLSRLPVLCGDRLLQIEKLLLKGGIFCNTPIVANRLQGREPNSNVAVYTFLRLFFLRGGRRLLRQVFLVACYQHTRSGLHQPRISKQGVLA